MTTPPTTTPDAAARLRLRAGAHHDLADDVFSLGHGLLVTGRDRPRAAQGPLADPSGGGDEGVVAVFDISRVVNMSGRWWDLPGRLTGALSLSRVNRLPREERLAQPSA
jgi:hypothetical protein